jgi:hypothetical protein
MGGRVEAEDPVGSGEGRGRGEPGVVGIVLGTGKGDLMLGRDAGERDVETALTNHIQRFILELGQGVAYLGKRYPLNVGCGGIPDRRGGTGRPERGVAVDRRIGAGIGSNFC